MKSTDVLWGRGNARMQESDARFVVNEVQRPVGDFGSTGRRCGLEPRLHPCQFYCYTERQGHAATGEPLAGSNRQRSRLPGRSPKFDGSWGID